MRGHIVVEPCSFLKEETCSSSQSLNGDYFDETPAAMREEMATLPTEQGEDGSSKAHCCKSFNEMLDDAKMLARQTAGRQKAIEDHNKNQLSNMDDPY